MDKLNEENYFWNKKNIFMYLIFGVYILLTTYSNTAWYTFSEGTRFYTILKLIRYIFYIFFVAIVMIKLVNKEYSKEAFGYFILLFIFSFIGIFTGKDKSLFLTIFYFACFFGYSSQRLIKYSTCIQGGLLLITVICALIGFADNSILDAERMRYSLGFNWSNLAPILYFFVILQYIYIRRKKITIIECVLIEIINILLYVLTNTKMSFFMLTVCIAILFIGVLSKTFKGFLIKVLNQFKKIIILMPVIGAFLACWLPLYNADSKIWYYMNNILSGRLWQCKNAIVKYGFSLFGKHIGVEVFSVANMGNSDQTYFIDSGYLHFAMKYGIIMLVLLVALYSIAIWKAYKNKDYYMICILIVISIFCIEDLYLISAFNVLIIYVFCDEDIFKDIPLLQKLSKPIGVVINKINSVFVRKEQ